ncbi:lysophospholipase L1-like esterase [Salana multivorans]|uniref:Lysophospholipase L1-like esterase n=1 Tax=Salana multivorans TaxID=120377 RepID=A0A3N2D9A7_9MICO|nr:SGNH/GDSL hydrolase family protein [Salana multivorans]ROR96375.1 lysophospholipase L1-like esterase [Salana multivorans]
MSAAVRYVAIGDSFTEGVGDEVAGTPRGWADLVAAGLADRHGEIDYANLAIRGRLLRPIATTQVDQVLALDPLPTMVTINGGGNDMLRRGMDAATLLGLIRTAAARVADAGIEPVLLAGPDPSARLPMPALVHDRGAELTDGVAALAEETGTRFVNVFADEEIREPRYWSADRLHLNPHGHRRAADLVLAGLGIPQPARGSVPPLAARPRLVDDAAFYGRYVLPWLGRRLWRRSSGDGRVAKLPTWTRVTAGTTGAGDA